jgi:hypothetical protein
MRLTSVRLPVRDCELVFLAASREEVSQSEFVRLALRERAERVLLGSARAGQTVRGAEGA